MLALALIAALAAPPWLRQLDAEPMPVPLRLAGKHAPRNLVLLRPGRPVRFSIAGPATVRLRIHGLLLVRRRGFAGPGAALVRVDTGEPETIELARKRVRGWSVRRRPLWRITARREVTLELGGGDHELVLWAGPGARLGAALAISVTRRTSRATARAAAPPGPRSPHSAQRSRAAAARGAAAQIATPTSEPSLTTAPPEPALAATPPEPRLATAPPQPPLAATPPEPALAATASEPRLATAPPQPPLAATPSEPRLAATPPEPAAGSGKDPSLARHGCRITTPALQRSQVVGPAGRERFYRVDIERGMDLHCVGPGTLLLDFHAHRRADLPESLRPVVVGVLLDDVLIQTVAMEQAASPTYVADGAAFRLSSRAVLRVPVEPGAHRVRLTLSDSAVLGASLRPRFEKVPEAPEPPLLTAQAARAGDLKIRARPGEARAPLGAAAAGSGVDIVASAWIPTGLSSPGALVSLDGSLRLPVRGPRLAIGVSAGLAWLSQRLVFANDRVPDGSTRAKLIFATVPLLLEVRWGAPLPPPFGVELGIGGGALLAWSRVSAAGVSVQGELAPTPAGTAQLTTSLALGPGALLVRFRFVVARPIETGTLRGLDPGGAFVGAGYGLRL